MRPANLPHHKCLSPRPCWKGEECRKLVSQPGHVSHEDRLEVVGLSSPSPLYQRSPQAWGSHPEPSCRQAWSLCTGSLWWDVLISSLHLPTYTRLSRFRRPGQYVQDYGTLALKKQEAATWMVRDAVLSGILGKVIEFLLVLNFRLASSHSHHECWTVLQWEPPRD